MHIGNQGIEVITHYEGLYLEAYWDDLGKVWTIGYGHTNNVYEGMVITKEQAIEFLKEDCLIAESYINSYVTYNLTQNMFDALVSFTFNLGGGTLLESDLLKFLNNGELQKAGDDMLLYVNAGGSPQLGLIRRRKTESILFLENRVEFNVDGGGGGTGGGSGGTGSTGGNYKLKNKYLYSQTDSLFGRKFTSFNNTFTLVKKIGDIAIIKDNGREIKVPFKNLIKI